MLPVRSACARPARPWLVRLGLASVAVAVQLVMWPAAAAAQAAVTLTDTSQTTPLTAAVSEQARVSIPALVTFNVTNVGANTLSGTNSVTVSNIVLATATKQLTISLQANAASFTPPVAGATTWAATDVSWSTANSGPNAWVNATRNNASLSNTSFTAVATCTADAASCSTTGLVFTLASKPTVKRSGAHSLTVTWKFEAIGT